MSHLQAGRPSQLLSDRIRASHLARMSAPMDEKPAAVEQPIFRAPPQSVPSSSPLELNSSLISSDSSGTGPRYSQYRASLKERLSHSSPSRASLASSAASPSSVPSDEERSSRLALVSDEDDEEESKEEIDEVESHLVARLSRNQAGRIQQFQATTEPATTAWEPVIAVGAGLNTSELTAESTSPVKQSSFGNLKSMLSPATTTATDPTVTDQELTQPDEQDEAKPADSNADNKGLHCMWYLLAAGGLLMAVAIGLALLFLLSPKDDRSPSASTQSDQGVDPDIAALVPSFVPVPGESAASINETMAPPPPTTVEAPAPVPLTAAPVPIVSAPGSIELPVARPSVAPSLRPKKQTAAPTSTSAVSTSSSVPSLGSASPPTLVPILSPREQVLFDMLANYAADEGASMLAPGPQRQALEWLADTGMNDPRKLDESRLRQRYALAVLFYSTSGAAWMDDKRWLEHKDECDWYNKAEWQYCDRDSTLTRLRLAKNGLAGTLPPEVGLLSHLELLDLSNNDLAGPLPEEIGQLRRLRVLRLQRNHLTGAIPSSLAGLNATGEIRLDGNDFAGSVPNEVCTVFSVTAPKFYVDCGGPSPSVQCPPGTCCSYCCNEAETDPRLRCQCVFAGSPLERDVC